MAIVPDQLEVLRERIADFFTNLDAGPPWPAKLRPLMLNRLRSLRGGCCGHPGEPGC